MRYKLLSWPWCYSWIVFIASLLRFLFWIDWTVPHRRHLVTVGSGGVMPAQPFQTAPVQTVFLHPHAAPSLSPAPQISSAWQKNEAGRNQTLINRCFIRQRAPDLPGSPVWAALSLLSQFNVNVAAITHLWADCWLPGVHAPAGVADVWAEAFRLWLDQVCFHEGTRSKENTVQFSSRGSFECLELEQNLGKQLHLSHLSQCWCQYQASPKWDTAACGGRRDSDRMFVPPFCLPLQHAQPVLRWRGRCRPARSHRWWRIPPTVTQPSLPNSSALLFRCHLSGTVE